MEDGSTPAGPRKGPTSTRPPEPEPAEPAELTAEEREGWERRACQGGPLGRVAEGILDRCCPGWRGEKPAGVSGSQPVRPPAGEVEEPRGPRPGGFTGQNVAEPRPDVKYKKPTEHKTH